MQIEEKDELLNNIELFYIKFAGSLVEYFIPKTQKQLDALGNFLENYIRPAIDNFKKEIKDSSERS